MRTVGLEALLPVLMDERYFLSGVRGIDRRGAGLPAPSYQNYVYHALAPLGPEAVGPVTAWLREAWQAQDERYNRPALAWNTVAIAELFGTYGPAAAPIAPLLEGFFERHKKTGEPVLPRAGDMNAGVFSGAAAPVLLDAIARIRGKPFEGRDEANVLWAGRAGSHRTPGPGERLPDPLPKAR
jgi:hypothetical protein